jgi:plasmid stabilization system protein ParE
VARYILAPAAARDLEAIYRYLLDEASLTVADRVETEIYRALEDLARLPSIGYRRADIRRSGFLSHTVFQYVILFRRTPHLRIYRIIHGARDIPRRL